MNSKKNMIIKRTSFLIVITILSVVGILHFNTKNDIEYILNSVDYSYLPLEAQNYIREVYENTGELILTEKNKIENYPYLNPEYIEYLETGEASEFGYIPEEVIVEHSYQDDFLAENQESSISELASLSYYNLREQGYITNIYNQGSEGLCWAFAGSTSLESHLAIKSKKQTMLTFSEKQIDYATTLNDALDVGDNPYITEHSSVLGKSLNQGGNMLRYINSSAIGISPMECADNCSYGSNYNKNNSVVEDKYWKYDYNIKTALSSYEVYNFDNTQYSLDEVLFFNPLVNQNEEEVNSLVKILKNQIVNNGSLYVSVGAYDNLSIEYTPTDGETALNTNGKNLLYYIPYGFDSVSVLNHAVSIIGWDDNYIHYICLDKTANKITNSTKKVNGTNGCSSSTETLHTIKGAWILQNSWGANSKTYIYLPYNTMKSSYKSISVVGENDFDNSYRATGVKTNIEKGNTKEIVSKVKLFISTYNQTIKVYYNKTNNNIIVNDGTKTSSGTLLKTLKTTYPGLYTIDLLDKNIVFDENVSSAMISFDTNDTDYYYYASLHTNNVENSKYIDINKISKVDEEILSKCNLIDNKCISTTQKISFDDNNVFVISGVTRNLTSNDNLTFKVLNNKKEDVTSLFHFFRNFSVSNYINTLISYNNNNVPFDNYIIQVYYNDVKYDELEWKLRKHNNILEGIGTKNNPHIVKNVIDLNDIRNHTTDGVIYGYYVLENNLDLTYNTQNEKGLYYNSGSGWNPIYNFAGSFEGNNHTITGLYINRPSATNDVGLFGTVYGNNNYIQNIILKEVNVKGNNNVAALIGGVYETVGFKINNVAIVNGKVFSSGNALGSIIGILRIKGDSSYTFYNLFNNATIGQSNSNITGGIIGSVDRTSPYDQEYNFTILDSVNLGNVYGGVGNTGGIIGDISGAKRLIFKNIISVGTYKNNMSGIIGDILGIGYNNLSVNMSNIYYTNNLYGSSFKLTDQTGITNNTKVQFNDIVTNNAINSFVYRSKWIYPEIDGIKRIPMLKTMVDYFDFTKKIDDIELRITDTININDLIKPKKDEVINNIKYTYDKDYLTIDSNGLITPKKSGVTTIHINSLYDGYVDDVQVTIKDFSNIIYNSNNSANESIIQKVLFDSAVNLDKNIFEYKGYIFKNWNTKADGSGDTYIDEQLIIDEIDDELYLYAQWEPKKYTIKFDSNSGVGELRSLEFEYPYSGKILFDGVTWFTKENYLFDSWNTKADGSGIKYLNNNLINFDEISFDENNETILYAQWKANKYFVTFDSNGGIGTMEKQTFIYDVSNKLSDVKFSRDGYTFNGWNTKVDGTGKTYSDKESIKLTSDIVLYAQWEINKYFVTFDSNGGIGTMEKQIFIYDVSNKLSDVKFSRDGYTFNGWNTKVDGTGNAYSDKESIKLTSDIVLYAQWKANKYFVTFDSNGGIGTMEKQTFIYDISNKLSDVKFSRDGYIFNGWNTKVDGTGNAYSDKESIKLTSDIVLYAQWKANKYFVTFDSNGGIGTMEKQIFIYDVSNKLSDVKFSRDGYAFNGWNTKVDGTGNAYSDKESIKLTSDIVLYAQWKANKYFVTFDSNGGIGTMEKQIFIYDVSNKLSDVKFSRDGYTFNGWNTKVDGTGKTYFDKETIKLTADIVLYAQWEESYSYIINKYIYDNNKKYIDKIDVNTGVDDFKKNIILNDNYRIYVDSKPIDDKNLLYTSGKTRIYKNGELFITYTNIIRGDVNGDGKINYLDYINIYNHIQKIKNPYLEKKKLENEFLIAADMSFDNKVNYLDYVYIYNKIKELKGEN